MTQELILTRSRLETIMHEAIQTIRTITFPTPKRVLVLSLACAITAAIATAIIWAIDLGLTAGISAL